MEVSGEKKGKYYLLYGVNKWSALEYKKMIDVLFFSKEGTPYFGRKIFKKEEKGEIDVFYPRLVFTYSADARMSLNYNEEMDMIIHDNLIPRLSRIDDLSRTLVPDGSYTAWKKNGDQHWVMIDKLENQIMDTAPRPTPILDQRKGRKIMGGDKH
jgi:hypothetical protein